MHLSPGLSYLIQRFPTLISPPLLAYLLFCLIQSFWEIHYPQWVVTCVLIASTPVVLRLQVLLKDLMEYREAAKLGAKIPTYIFDPTPGGIATIIVEAATEKTGYLSDGIEEISKKMKGYTFGMRQMYGNRIVTAEPEYIKAILSTQFDNFEKGLEFRTVVYPILGNGVFAADGDLWKFHRSMTRPFFSRDRLSDFDNFDRHTEDALNMINKRLKEGHPVDFQDVVSRFTLDSATEFLFGNDMKSLASGLPYPFYSEQAKSASLGPTDTATRFTEAFAKAQLVTVNRLRFGKHWPLLELWGDKMKGPMKVVRDVIDPIVSEAVARKNAKQVEKSAAVAETRGVNDETLLEHLVNSTDDETILRDEIMSLLVAGRDTTASTLSFTVYLLAQHEQVLQRLRGEILEKVGAFKRPTHDDFRDMKYLRAVINETLRLYPPVPFNIRSTTKQTLWPSKTPGGKPFYIPANTRVPYSVYYMQRRTDLWGPDALEFDPDRFLDERLHKYLTPNPFIFLPFNAGPRICLGQQFAYNEMSFFLVRLLQRFSDISLASDAQPPASRTPERWSKEGGRKGKEKIRLQNHLTMHLKGGLWVRMMEAGADELDIV